MILDIQITVKLSSVIDAPIIEEINRIEGRTLPAELRRGPTTESVVQFPQAEEVGE